nr:MAG TPA: hypothetical protein [Crassvirales sp.]
MIIRNLIRKLIRLSIKYLHRWVWNYSKLCKSRRICSRSTT